MSVRLVFHGELAELLNNHGGDSHPVRVLGRLAPVKDLVESQGVPHTEVGLIISENRERSFFHIPASSEDVDVFPHTPPVDVTEPTILFPKPFKTLSFIVDVNVGRLARLLRLGGFDTLYDPRWDDSQIAETAGIQERIVLTGDRELLKRNAVVRGRLIRASDPWEQFAETARFFGLAERIELFCRCPRCNALLEPVEKADVADRLEPLTRLMYDTFTLCPACGQVYWRGSHHSGIRRKIGEALQDSSRAE